LVEGAGSHKTSNNPDVRLHLVPERDSVLKGYLDTLWVIECMKKVFMSENVMGIDHLGVLDVDERTVFKG
jgi:hypothetical protein